MATATTTAQKGPRTIHLTNGNVVTIDSNEATTEESIPLIDISRMYSEDVHVRQALAEDIREASRSIGFFLITNHVSLGTRTSASRDSYLAGH